MLLGNNITDAAISAKNPQDVENMNATPEATEEELVKDSKELSPAVVQSVASSHMNFAVRMLRQFCTEQELKRRNIAGCRGKISVEQDKVKNIRALVFQYYPVAPSEREKLWSECRKAMDSYLRRLNKKYI